MAREVVPDFFDRAFNADVFRPYFRFPEGGMASVAVGPEVESVPDDSSHHLLPAAGDEAFYIEEDAAVSEVVLMDIFARPSVLLGVRSPRRIHNAGMAMLIGDALQQMTFGVFFLFFLFKALERNILRRIESLDNQVRGMVRLPADERTLSLSGEDEISELAGSMNAMFRDLRDHEQLHELVQDSVQVGIMISDADSNRVEDVNPFLSGLLGLDPESLRGRDRCLIFQSDEADDSERTGRCELFVRGRLIGLRAEYPVLRTVTMFQHSGRTMRLETFTDLSEVDRAQEALRASEARYRTIFENAASPSVLYDENRIIRAVNRPFVELYGAESEEEVLGLDWLDILPEEFGGWLARLHQERERGDHVPGFYEGVLLTKSGKERHVRISVSLIPDTSTRVVFLIDLTDRVLAAEKLQKQAFFDSLTGLPNRRLFNDRLDQAVRRARRTGKRVGLILMDLDGFKHVNDSLGHQAGDELLEKVASRFREGLRETDTVARLGGDEFTLIAEDIDSPDDISLVARRVRSALVAPFDIGGVSIHLAVSMGMTIFPDDAETATDLTRNADLAMYSAKGSGSGWCFFTEELNRRAHERLRIEQDLRRALREEEFTVHYQPQVCLKTGELKGVEALVRWEHPERGLVPPSEFIPFAESSGLVVPLDLMVLRIASRAAARWNRNREEPLRLSVNLSAWHLRNERLPEELRDTLEESGLPPEYLEIEITETAYMENILKARPLLETIRHLGVTFALDDFGTGYSSLSYLRDMPFTTLKIDKSFVDTLSCTSDDDDFLLRTIVGIGKRYNMVLVAEGVDDDAQIQCLQSLGCHIAQGFLFSRPVTEEAFEQFL